VVVGIQPGVAVAMARLGTTLHPVSTALDLEEGIDLLDHDEGPDRVGLLGDADAVDPRW
jgi:hypothetical protein